MATVDYQSKDKDNEEENQSTQNQPQSVVDPNLQNQQSGSAFSSDGSLNTGAGPGGQGNWTNIQAYLNANQNDKSSETLANNYLNTSFGMDQGKALGGSVSAISQANKDLNSKQIRTDEASRIIDDAQTKYQYGMPQSDAYNQQINQIRNSLNAQYGGPQNYNYGISQESQDYGKGLQDAQSYQNMLNNIYQRSANGTMGSGMLALQNQLDSQNQGLQDLRSTQLKNYNNMVSAVNNTNTATNQKLDEIKAQYDPSNLNSYKNALNRYLNQAQNNSYAGLNQAANDWNLNSNPVGDDALNILNAAKDTGVYGLYQLQNRTGKVYDRQDRAKRNANTPAQEIDMSKYYRPSISASISNIGGQDKNRNTYNTISDILNSNNYINNDTANAPDVGFEDRTGLINDLQGGFNKFMKNEERDSDTMVGTSGPTYDEKMASRNKFTKFMNTIQNPNFYQPKYFATPSKR